MTSPDHIEAARIEVKLHREHLASPDERPALKDCIWVENIPCGPSQEGVQRLRQVQEHYGMCNVTTGNARTAADTAYIGLPSSIEPIDTIRTPESRWVCGVYVRESAYEDAPNPLRSYLS